MTLPDSARVEPEQTVPTTVDELAPLYRQMLAIRRMEEAAAKAYSQGKIGGFLHLIIGQEAVCVGSIAALKPDDYVVATYREHGHAYAKGIAARPIMAELYGKKTGLVKGLGGSMHLFDKSAPTSSAVTASSAATCRSRPARPSRRSTATTAA
jgi:pyruvate dehydrogenase E1 component alpha subunit